ncbi:MAG: hypothetical protein ACOY3P_11865 [Planctomycetota bacterium]
MNHEDHEGHEDRLVTLSFMPFVLGVCTHLPTTLLGLAALDPTYT